MLNRRYNNVIFYGGIAVIALAIVLIRVIVVGGQRSSIEQLDMENESYQLEIDELSLVVQDNKNSQTGQLYELYYKVPNIYSEETLEYKTVAMLEELGISDTQDFNRKINIYNEVDININGSLGIATSGYKVVQVEVKFTTNDITYVTDFIDLLLENGQLFILDTVKYTDSIEDVGVEMTVSFFAVYDVPVEIVFDPDAEGEEFFEEE